MPLFVDGSAIHRVPSTVPEWIRLYPHFKDSAAKLTSQSIHTVDGKKLLYVMQRELAIVSPTDDAVDFVGSDDATTCHIGILIHSGSKVVALCHFDGYETEKCCEKMIEKVKSLSYDVPGRLELHLIGGFIDDRLISENLTNELCEILHSFEDEIHIKTFCVTDLNDILKGSIHFPVIYGVAVNVKTGEIFRAEFPYKGPEISLRHSRIFAAGADEIWDVYDNDSHQMIIEPFSFISDAVYQAKMWSQAPDHLILKHLSTSGAQEPDGYAEGVRTHLKFILTNPDTSKIFKGWKPLRFHLTAEGDWKRL